MKKKTDDEKTIDQQGEERENASPAPFAFTIAQLQNLIDPKNIDALRELGGLAGILKGLHTDATFGLSKEESAPFDPVTLDDIRGLSSEKVKAPEPEKVRGDIKVDDVKTADGVMADTKKASDQKADTPNKILRKATQMSTKEPTLFPQRKTVYGTNVLPAKKPKNILQLMWMAFQEKILILLTVAAVISLALGIYEDLTTANVQEVTVNGQTYTEYYPDVKWVEGVAIIVAIIIVVLVGSINDYQKERQFMKLNAKKEDTVVKVTRSGEQCHISVHDLLVGDIVHIEPGDIIAADGIFIMGHNLKCDESGATGESDAIRKLGWEDCYKLHERAALHDDARSVSVSSAMSAESPNLSKPIAGQQDRDGHLMAPLQNDGTSEAKPALPQKHNLPDPFMISGSKVLEGVGTYVVIAVGINSFHGKTMMALRQEAEDTPLQVKLNFLAEKIAKLGLAAALLMLLVLLIKFFVGFRVAVPRATDAIQAVLQIVITAVTVVVVAVPEGLPLAVTLALAYATTRMLKDNNLVRVLAACETMGNATTVCSDKTGTLTQNRMTVVTGTFGAYLRFMKDPSAENERRSQAFKRSATFSSTQPGGKTDTSNPPTDDNPSITIHGRKGTGGIPPRKIEAIGDLHQVTPKPVLRLLHESVCINSTAFEGVDDRGQRAFLGNKTESALLGFSKELQGPDYKELRDKYPIVQVFPFSSDRKAMATVVEIGGAYRMYVKGASEVILSKAKRIVETDAEKYADSVDEVKTTELTPEIAKRMQKIIVSYATKSLRTIGIAYRDFDSWPPQGVSIKENSLEEEIEEESPEESKRLKAIEVEYDDLINAKGGLILQGIVGIEDPLRDGVKEAVLQCQKAGVFVRMVTGDNVLTAQSIARQCGIYTEGGIVMEGPTFRKLPPDQMDTIIPRLQVLARSSPEDKRILVGRLKQMGEVVAVTGDGTNDGPALKMADIGFSMGIAGTEVAKEASSIILMDDNFSSIVKAMMWGRCVNDSIKKFLQFQLTVNVTAVLITFISAVSNTSSEKSILSAVQLLWVNLIMDTLAALALATDPPTPDLLNRLPESRNAPLITITMWKMILGQALFQLAATLVLLYSGADLLNYPVEAGGHLSRDTQRRLQSLVFNTFVFLQIFNELNCRNLNNRLNVFSGLQRNKFFIIIFIIMIGGQILIVTFGSDAFQTTSLGLVEWLVSVLVGACSLLVGVIIRLIPDELLIFLFKLLRIPIRPQYFDPTIKYKAGAEGKSLEWQSPITHLKNELSVFKSVRGGRLHSHMQSKADSHTGKPVSRLAAAMLPTMVATSVGAPMHEHEK
ncbi:uncharacterized protein VTP21DRAFT_9409 [Calcarisporiella thermophila]|uniref:uncharacterized protein n=1 Tax=Calcarisporiella thermophila TaxID=911321 RepID=UPI003742F338